MLSLLKTGAINTNELLLGYKQDGTPFYSSWDSVRSGVIGGRSRSGKTCTLVFFIVQALLSGAKVYVNDIHYNKPSGLLKILSPLLPFITVGRTVEEILQNVQEYNTEMQARLSDHYNGSMQPYLFVTDEWTILLRNMKKEDRDILVKLILDISQGYAGVNGYCLISGHVFTSKESGGSYGTSVRRAFHSVMVHRLDSDYAAFLLAGENLKYSKKSPNLPTGSYYFQDAEGEEVIQLTTPYYGNNKEAITFVAEMLQEQLQLPDIDQSTNIRETPPVLLSQNATLPEVKQQEDSVTQEQENAKFIVRLRKRGIAHRDIAYALTLYGPNYGAYQQLCNKYSIPINDEIVKQN